MKKWAICAALLLLFPLSALGDGGKVWQLCLSDGSVLTEICYEPVKGDIYIGGDNQYYEVVKIRNTMAIMDPKGEIQLPELEWMDPERVIPVAAYERNIGLYCTHSDESYEPSDGFYSTRQRGTIYQVAGALADELAYKGVNATVSQVLHHPHDAGAYRRSRQTAVELIKTIMPDCLIDIHRDGITDPNSYAVTIGGEKASKIRLLVGRGNQNAALNKDFALMIKAVADRVYPGLIKDIYMGRGAFNQDLLPRSILLECGTYTLKKECVLASMPMMADVINRALYGGVVGSAGTVKSDTVHTPEQTAGIKMGLPENEIEEAPNSLGSGFSFLGVMLLIGLVGFAMLSSGSPRRGARKAARNLSEMTGGLIGKKPDKDERPEHS